jgi:hypothetical protein
VSRDDDRAMNWQEDGPALSLPRALPSASGGFITKRMRAERHHRDVVRAIYTIAKGRDGAVVDLDDLLGATDLSDEKVFNVLDRLEQDGAIQTFNGNCVMLLQKGIEAYERSSASPELVLRRPGLSDRPGLVATSPAAIAAQGRGAA